jgi:hypothetical protein
MLSEFWRLTGKPRPVIPLCVLTRPADPAKTARHTAEPASCSEAVQVMDSALPALVEQSMLSVPNMIPPSR